MQAFELLIEDDDLCFYMKQPASTDFLENKETQPTEQHIFNCNIGGMTGEDVTMEVHQPIEHQPNWNQWYLYQPQRMLNLQQ